MLNRLPWITVVLAVLFCFTPLAWEIYHGAFISGEAISNSLSQFLLIVVIGIAIVLLIVETLIRWWWRRRRKQA